MKIVQIKFFLLGVMLIFAGCKDLDLAPTNQFTEMNYWTSQEKAELVLNTAYSQMFNSGRFFYNEALSDNAYVGRGDPQNAKTISAGQHNTATNRFASEWGDRYAGIKTVNVFLENVDRVDDMDEAIRERMKAEARFLRAFNYFYLTTWFGDVPLFDKDISFEESTSISRTAQSVVLEFVHSELEAVSSVLPTNEEYADEDAGRITKGAAIALKARVYLYSNDWPNVVSTCERLMDNSESGNYGLFPSYEGVFLPENEYNSEVILDLQYVPSLRTHSQMFDLAPLSVGARLNDMAATQELVDSYLMLDGTTIEESGSYNENSPYVDRDPRLTATVVYHEYEWVKPDNTTQTIYIEPGTAPDSDAAVDEYEPGSNATSTGYYLRKYYDPTSLVNFESGLNLILIRYADVLLMYAEAKNELNEMNQNVWETTIQALRERAGFIDAGALNYDASLSQGQLRDIIRRERRSELAMEGLRIFDIRRWETAENVLNGYPHGAKFGDPSVDDGYIRLEKRTFDPAKDYLWPIPRAERDLNPNLTQNPNWQSE
jgi:hypothetical protein